MDERREADLRVFRAENTYSFVPVFPERTGNAVLIGAVPSEKLEDRA